MIYLGKREGIPICVIPIKSVQTLTIVHAKTRTVKTITYAVPVCIVIAIEAICHAACAQNVKLIH